MKSNTIKMFATAMLLSAAFQNSTAEIPQGYYDGCENKGGQKLLTALCSAIKSHTTISYKGLWNVYPYSDMRPDGTLWDMYSTKAWPSNFKKCGNYSAVGDCVNREHSFPKSWFSNASPMVSDAFHVYPTDGKVNGQRSNYPYGECAGGTTLASSGDVKPLGRLGTCTSPGYTGKVFEPDDEYKGDFARTYFYMIACYNERVSSWSSDMLAGNSYPAFTTWAKDVLLKWHRQDPVSEKEINRNEAVYARQGNRNPFIDHPEMAEYIWGTQVNGTWTSSGTIEPQISLPVSGTTVNAGTTMVNVARSVAVKVKGANLSENVSVAVSGAAFSVSPATLTAAAATTGADVTVTFLPTLAGSFSGTLTITSGDAKSTVTLAGEAVSTLPAGPATHVNAEGFTATWSYVGDANASGCYTLDVKEGSTSIAGYPRTVTASAEKYDVTGLDSETQYNYTVSSNSYTSAPVSVTTSAPEPSITVLYDDDPIIYGEPGVPSDPAELLLEIEYVTTAITASVEAPFELSTDKSTWSTTINIDPEEDRMYLRVSTAQAGTYNTSITLRAGDYMNDDAEFTAIVALAGSGFFEDFEQFNTGDDSYNNHVYNGSNMNWDFVDAGMWASDAAHGGSYAVRMGKTEASSITTIDNITQGLGVVTVYTAKYGSDADAAYDLQYSTDGGSTWTTAGTGTVTTSSYAQQTFIVNKPSPVLMRLQQTGGKRFLVDDIEASPYASGADETVADYHTWDAYACNGQIVIEAVNDATVYVYALDGTVVFGGSVAPGRTCISVAPALYIVTVDDYARRVLVK